jgi:formylglycine-generating enzyme required for sulfatase activity
MKDDGRQWIVGVSTKDDVGRDRVLWLRLAFARALPQIADWPSARYATPVAAAGKRFVPSGKRTQDASLKIAADEEYQSLQRMFADGKIDDVLALAEAAAGRFGGTEFAKQFVQLRDDIRAKKAEKDKPAAPAGPKIVAGSIGIQLAFVPGGEYVLGDGAGEQDEKPEGKITVGAYFISVHEITNAQFERFDSRRTRTNYSKEDNAPVVNVSHKDAVAFCEWLSKQERVVYRLPTEAEWEIAARGTDQRTYPWGNDGPDAGGTYRANYRQGADPAMASADGFASVSPVGSYPQGASPFGCLDMAGNVWEWCSDWYAEDYYQKRPATNPKGPARGQERVLRGGSWYHSAALARSANRHKLTPTNPQPTVGFRVVREAPSYNVE